MDLEVIVGSVQPTENNNIWAVNLITTVTSDQLRQLIDFKKKGQLDIFIKGSD